MRLLCGVVTMVKADLGLVEIWCKICCRNSEFWPKKIAPREIVCDTCKNKYVVEEAVEFEREAIK